MLKRISVFFTLLIVSACANQDSTITELSEISVSEVKAKIDSAEQILLLDVRTGEEFDGSLGHIDGAILIPLQELMQRISELDDHKDKEIIVICHSGSRSGIATQLLRDKGYNALNMDGGMIAWNYLLEQNTKQD